MPDTIKLPTLKDHHSHPLLYASMARAVDPGSVESRAEAQRLVREQAGHGDIELVLVLGWRSEKSRTAVTGLKLFADGAIGPRTAGMREPFIRGTTGSNHGMLVYSDDELRSTIECCLNLKPALAIHAIGDWAIEQVIATLEKIDLKADRRIRFRAG